MLLLLRKLKESLSKQEKFNFLLLSFGMFTGTLSEIFSIALIIPFLSLIKGNQEYKNSSILMFFENFLGIQSIKLFSLIIISIFIFSSLLRLYILNTSNKFAAKLSNNLVYKAYYSILNEDYVNLIKESKSKFISIIHTNGNQLLLDLMMQLLILFESLLFLSLIVITLFLYNWKIFIIFSIFLLIFYFYFIQRSNKVLKLLSSKMVEFNKNALERLDIDLNSIEYIHLGNYQKQFSLNYAQNDKNLKFDYAKYIVIARTPKIIIEYVFLIGLILFMVILYFNNTFESSLPIISAGGLLTLKCFPHIQKIFESWTFIKNYKDSILSLLDYSNKYKKNIDKKDHKKLNLINFKQLRFENVSFSYQKEQKCINKINFSVKRGEKIALMGPSGAGKTTILRLICGLLLPTSGKIIINDFDIGNKYNLSHKINWMRTIGYVPQKINITGRTLRENIIFGSKPNNINSLDIEEIIKITLLEELVDRCNGLDTNIIQNSFSLSGGENQRIAIARALYRNPKLLLMDEPTSSLDVTTQKKLFDNLLDLKDTTFIVITHRIETKYFFDKIYEIKGKLLFQH